MPQAGIDPPRQSHATYEASALPPSHHGWIIIKNNNPQIKNRELFSFIYELQQKKPCVFPFKYKGKIYNGCITVNDPKAKAWCSTEVDDGGSHILNQEFWGHCTNDCYVDIEGFVIGSLQGTTRLLFMSRYTVGICSWAEILLRCSLLADIWGALNLS